MATQPISTMPPSGPPPGGPAPRAENLALIFQEMFTVILRLRSGRHPVTDAEVFRGQVRQAIRVIDQDARRRGYNDEDIRLAIFAAVAFLDETVLNLQSPIFNDWVRRPLQEEFFGRHVAGELFFHNLRHLLARRDSLELADLLEVYYLCLLLGYSGRYSIAMRSELKAIKEEVDEKIRRIRGSSPELSPAWALPPDSQMRPATDRWVRRLMYVAGGLLLVAIVLFVIYKFSLASGATSLRELIGQRPR